MDSPLLLTNGELLKYYFADLSPAEEGWVGAMPLRKKIRKESSTSTAPFRCNNVNFEDIISPIQAT